MLVICLSISYKKCINNVSFKSCRTVLYHCLKHDPFLKKCFVKLYFSLFKPKSMLMSWTAAQLYPRRIHEQVQFALAQGALAVPPFVCISFLNVVCNVWKSVWNGMTWEITAYLNLPKKFKNVNIWKSNGKCRNSSC